MALLGILQRRSIGAFRHSQRESGDRDAPAVENAHGVDEPVPFPTEKIFGGDEAVFENEFGGVAGAQAEFVFFFSGAKALGVFVDDEPSLSTNSSGRSPRKTTYCHRARVGTQ